MTKEERVAVKKIKSGFPEYKALTDKQVYETFKKTITFEILMLGISVQDLRATYANLFIKYLMKNE